MKTIRIGGTLVRILFLTLCFGIGVHVAVAADTNTVLQEINQLIDQEKYSEALSVIDTQQTAGEPQPSLELLKGAVLVRSGELDKAMAVFESLAEAHPNDAAIFNNMGVIHAEKGEMEKAREAFAKALKISPDYEQALYNLADVYTELACRTYGKINDPDKRIVPGFCQPATKTVASSASGSKSEAQNLSDEQTAVLAFVTAWKENWAEQDVDAYLSSYSETFSPDGMSHKSWIDQRQRALKRPEWIRIEIENPVINLAGTQATVRFIQKYTASNYQDVVIKQLTLDKQTAGWMIVKETVL